MISNEDVERWLHRDRRGRWWWKGPVFARIARHGDRLYVADMRFSAVWDLETGEALSLLHLYRTNA